MSAAVQVRRDRILVLLREVPAGLTREEIADMTGQPVVQVKLDLLNLKEGGSTVCRSGGRAANSTHGYRRVWFAVPKTTSPLYDALMTSLEAGASISLTPVLLRKLREELTEGS